MDVIADATPEVHHRPRTKSSPRGDVSPEQLPAIVAETTGGATWTTLVLPADITREQWRDVGRKIGQAASGLHFWLADWLLAGERAGYVERGRYTEAAALTGYKRHTLQNIACVGRAIPPDDREPRLRFKHHRLVQALDSDARRGWLTRAVEGAWNARQLHDALEEERHAEAVREEQAQEARYAQESQQGAKAAREEARKARERWRREGGPPEVCAAYKAGKLSAGQVDALNRLDPETQVALLADVVGKPPKHTREAVKAIIEAQRTEYGVDSLTIRPVEHAATGLQVAWLHPYFRSSMPDLITQLDDTDFAADLQSPARRPRFRDCVLTFAAVRLGLEQFLTKAAAIGAEMPNEDAVRAELERWNTSLEGSDETDEEDDDVEESADSDREGEQAD